MLANKNNVPRGALSSVPMVMLIVVFFLIALGVWMWIDMNRHDLEGKAKAYVESKQRNQSFESPAPNPVAPVAPTASPFGFPLESGAVECRRATSPILIDGLPNDAAWRDAQVIGNFTQTWVAPNHPAKSRTTARLLWDDQNLYFLAEMDDLDVFADITRHNGDLWNNDVFELFLKPSATGLGYYEFEINPNNATLEVYFPSRGSGGLRRWAKPDAFHLETKVTMRGGSTLNNPSDRDIGWVVEGRIPWSDFAPTGGKPNVGDEWRFALCRFDFSVQNEQPEMSSSAPLKEAQFHRYEDYTVLKFK